jgi:hypothetical protein
MVKMMVIFVKLLLVCMPVWAAPEETGGASTSPFMAAKVRKIPKNIGISLAFFSKTTVFS